jgi:hypothetical protein
MIFLTRENLGIRRSMGIQIHADSSTTNTSKFHEPGTMSIWSVTNLLDYGGSQP